jgi:iron(III) transport system permease protein
MLVVGYVLAFNKPPIAITGTWLIIVMIFAVRSIPTALRAGVASLQQIDPSIEEAATNLGADSQHVFRTITLPLIQPALLAGMIYSFTRHMTSLSAVIFVVSPGWKIMTQQILDEVEAARLGNAAAYSVVLIVIVLIAIAILYRLTGQAREAGEMVAF